MNCSNCTAIRANYGLGSTAHDTPVSAFIIHIQVLYTYRYISILYIYTCRYIYIYPDVSSRTSSALRLINSLMRRGLERNRAHAGPRSGESIGRRRRVPGRAHTHASGRRPRAAGWEGERGTGDTPSGRPVEPTAVNCRATPTASKRSTRLTTRARAPNAITPRAHLM